MRPSFKKLSYFASVLAIVLIIIALAGKGQVKSPAQPVAVSQKPIKSAPNAKATPLYAQFVSLTATPSPTSPLIRVGLSTKGAALQFWSRGALLLIDSALPTRRLTVPERTTISVTWLAPPPAAPGVVATNGALQVQAEGQSYVFGPMLRIAATDEPTHISSNGGSPAVQRAYHGDFEVAPQTYSFEPATHKGPLRLVNIVSLDDYLKGVVPWEMDRTAPPEALKAQALCARSETLAKIRAGRHARDGFDICDYDHCQGYAGTENETEASSTAVEQTSGLAIYYHDQIADAVYGTNSGGITAAAEDVWSGPPEPYLRSVNDFSKAEHKVTAQVVKPEMGEADWIAYCTQNLPSFAQPTDREVRRLASRRQSSPRTAALFQENDLPQFYRWTRTVAPRDLALCLAARAKMDEVTSVKVAERSPSGHIKKLTIEGTFAKQPVSLTLKGDSQIRAMMSGRLGSTSALPSSTFVVLPVRDETGTLTSFVFKGAGWGHGCGMCQTGAMQHARQGWTARQIVSYYFRDVEVRKIS